MFDAARVDAAGIALTALATLVAGLVGAYIGAQVQARREHAAWLRDKRFAVCRAYLISHDWQDLDQKVGTKRRKDLPPPADYYAEFALLGMPEISAGAAELDAALRPLSQMALKHVPFDPHRFETLQAEHDRIRAAWVESVLHVLKIEAL